MRRIMIGIIRIIPQITLVPVYCFLAVIGAVCSSWLGPEAAKKPVGFAALGS
jgi:hypothetical protein